MDSAIRDTSAIGREIDITLTKAELEPYLNNAYRNAQQKVSLKGFRKGKTPVSLIKKMYGPALEAEATEEAVQQEFAKAAESQDLRPIGNPQVTNMKQTDDGGMQITVAYEVFPQFELGTYKGISARKIYHTITDDEVNDELERLRERYAMPEPAESVADEDHLVTLDIQKLDEAGQPIEGEVNRDIKLYLRRQEANPELKAAVMNKKLGDTFRIDLPTGVDESNTPYEITVKDVQYVTLPDAGDEFAKKVTSDDSVTGEQLRDIIRQNIDQYYTDRYSRLFRDELVAKLVEEHNFAVPEVLIQEALKSFREDMKKNKKDLPADFDPRKFDQEMRPVAERTVRWALVRERIVEKEELVPDDADYEGLAQMESQRTGIDYERLVEYFKNAPQIQDRILAEKALQLIEDYAVVQEIEDTEPGALAQEHTHDHGDHDHAHDHSHDHGDGHVHDHEHEHSH